MKATVVITGTSTGIGRDFARRALELGWTVVATARNPAKIDLPSSNRLHKIALDVTSEASVAAFAEELGKLPLEGPLLLLNNAGVVVAGPLEAVPVAEWERQLDTNVLGVVRVTQALLPRIRDSKGRIVNIGSVSGRLALPFLGPYSASKYALRALTDSLRRELRPLGVKVILIEPGAIKTPIWEKSRADGDALEAKMTPLHERIYGEALKIFSDTALATGAAGLPVETVTRSIEKAFTRNCPPNYIAPSFIHRLMSLMATLVPSKWADALLDVGFRGQRSRRN